MANLIRKYPGNEIAQSGAAWDPVRLMRDMLRWDPFREVEAVLGPGDVRGFAPTFEVTETKDAYLFRADLPGVQEKDLEISLTGTRLAISGHREQERHEQSDTFYASERAYGSFTRSFTLPEGRRRRERDRRSEDRRADADRAEEARSAAEEDRDRRGRRQGDRRRKGQGVTPSARFSSRVADERPSPGGVRGWRIAPRKAGEI